MENICFSLILATKIEQSFSTFNVLLFRGPFMALQNPSIEHEIFGLLQPTIFALKWSVALKSLGYARLVEPFPLMKILRETPDPKFLQNLLEYARNPLSSLF